MISHIDIRNFKCFEDERIPLGAITLVTGLNSTGKSTFLQSILVLRQSHLQKKLQMGLLALNGELVELGSGRDALYEMAEEQSTRLGLSWDDGIAATWQFGYEGGTDVLPASHADMPQEAAERPPFNAEFHYLSAERIGPRKSFGLSEHSVANQRQLGTRGEYTGHFLIAHGAEEVFHRSLMHQQAADTTLKFQVEAWLSEVSPGVRLHVTQVSNSVDLRYSFAGPYGGTNQYQSKNVGFGLTYTLSVLTAILASRSESLLIIENPEAHLHPRGQVQLALLLARAAAAGVQVIVETHSDHILNGLRLAVHDSVLAPDAACIHYFERRVTTERIYHTYSSPKIDTNGRLDHWPEGFFDEWEIALGRLMGTNKGAS